VSAYGLKLNMTVEQLESRLCVAKTSAVAVIGIGGF